MTVIYVPVVAGDNELVLVAHTPEEYAQLVEGCVDVDTATAAVTTTPLEED